MMRLEIMDTTLRDGEQTQGISFSPGEKLQLAKFLLTELGVDRVEIASARVSEGEFNAARKIARWAAETGKTDRVEVLGFIDNGQSIQWIQDAGLKVVNLLSKGSLRHLEKQLRKTPEEHVNEIKREVQWAKKSGIAANIYLEDWSNGMLQSPEYVYFMLDALKEENILRFMLPDTLGILNPDQTYTFCKKIRDRYPDLHFDFHAHNDYDLSVANVLASVKAGFNGIHTTINGLGERAGNAPLSSIVGVLHDHLKVKTGIVEKNINRASHLVERFSGIRIPVNKPIVGENVFTQTSGIHADGDSKDHLYYNDLLPERFGRTRKYALGKLSGKASIKKNLETLGYHLDNDALRQVTQRIIELGDRKESVTADDLPYIIADVLDNGALNKRIFIKNYTLTLSGGMRPMAHIRVQMDKDVRESSSIGDGQYDAFMKALWKIYDDLGKEKPVLTDYRVTIPPGGKTDALVETIIKWEFHGHTITTKGLDGDQTVAAIKATEKMLNIIEQKTENIQPKKINKN
ncbi:2-isopropylmalate synthase [Candidatus Sulfidibacterium hydrothermale]|uniref:alpha-isopropylmalate synthase regulatory domain-containing protein n=1 Tax=Candidatus Sulfidibacterium hydrothermale TaxID=2875962 RepID=UPI001F0B0B9A|nr:alpha-isopropylmalate synthase regulatory domain-containing protein [Candidatus Sulfidibacterium hydrothermale]UBM62111.1 2-isopropylmalate synthase [Candidatus Sulfidibacterium hydrothermale]